MCDMECYGNPIAISLYKQLFKLSMAYLERVEFAPSSDVCVTDKLIEENVHIASHNIVHPYKVYTILVRQYFKVEQL